MDRFCLYRVFAQGAEMGSFIKAAHALGLARASACAAVRQLELVRSARLLHRTTRQLRPIAGGLQLLDRVRTLLAEAKDVEQLFGANQYKLSGRLNVPRRIARLLNGHGWAGARRLQRLDTGWRQRRRPRLQTRVVEDLFDHRLRQDGCSDLELTATVRAALHVDLEREASVQTNLHSSSVGAKPRLSNRAQLSRARRQCAQFASP